jgi:tetratricopeptide (TPR) repeat protein
VARFGEDIGAMIGLVDRALTDNPSFARGWRVSGLLRSFAGDHDLALKHIKTSLRLSPRERTGQTLSAMGAAHFFKRQFDEAVSKLLLSIQDDPGFPTAYRELAACYAHMGRLRRSARHPRSASHYYCDCRAERSPLAQSRRPRAILVGRAPRDGRDELTATRRHV